MSILSSKKKVGSKSSKKKTESSKKKTASVKTKVESVKTKAEYVKTKVESSDGAETKKDIIAKNPTHEPILKEYVSKIVYDCFADNYNTGKECYLLVIGGEAINHYIPNKKDKVATSDFDLKLVVNPEFTKDEETLKSINVKRLKIIRKLMQCLSKITPPPGYEALYPKLAIKVHDQPRFIYLEGNKLFWVDPVTGEEKFIYYALNKVFTILLCYQLKKDPITYGFGLIDLSLFYKKPHDFSYFGAKIYEAFLNSPFDKKIPIPFVVHNNVRFPTLPYLLHDTYRMILISLDNLSINKDNPEKIVFWNSKIEKYWQKLIVIINIMKQKNPPTIMEDVAKAAKKCFENYKPLAFLNMLCFRTGIVYSTEMKELPECDDKYKKELANFENCYLDVSSKIAKLRY